MQVEQLRKGLRGSQRGRPLEAEASGVWVASLRSWGRYLPSVPSGGQECGGGDPANPTKGGDLRGHAVWAHVAPADETVRPEMN